MVLRQITDKEQGTAMLLGFASSMAFLVMENCDSF